MVWLIAAVVVVVVFLVHRGTGLLLFGLLATLWIGLWITTEQKVQPQVSDPSVTVVARHDPQLCPDPNAPISIEIVNNADRTLENISFSLSARLPGHSAISYRSYHSSDRILPPGQTLASCYRLNTRSFTTTREAEPEPGELEWTTAISLTRFAQ